VIGATTLVLLGGAAGAVAATQSSGTGLQAYINDLASRLNVTPSALESAIKAANSDQINAALAAGKLTQAQADALKARIQADPGIPFFGRGIGGGGFGRHFGGGLGGFGGLGRGAVDSAAAQYLGISEATLRADLRAGQSLAQIAGSTSNKDVAGLKAAITAAVTSQLNTAVANKEMTAAQEQQFLTDLSSRLDTLLNSTWTPGPWGGGPRGHGFWAGGPAIGATGPTGASGTTGLYGT